MLPEAYAMPNFNTIRDGTFNPIRSSLRRNTAAYRNSAPICVPRRHFTRAGRPAPALRDVSSVKVFGTN